MSHEELIINPIAHIHTHFSEKFGIPRQSGLAPAEGFIVFEEEYKNHDFIKGLEDFSYIWVIWAFSENIDKKKTPTVRPPKLGGNEHVGVFATRSPFRPNNLGISSLKQISIDRDADDGPILHVSGVDMLDNTPIYDIKPYLAYSDSHSDARGGFTDVISLPDYSIDISPELEGKLPSVLREEIYALLRLNPRPGYHNDPERIYGMAYAGYNICFKVDDSVIKVISISEENK